MAMEKNEIGLYEYEMFLKFPDRRSRVLRKKFFSITDILEVKRQGFLISDGLYSL